MRISVDRASAKNRASAGRAPRPDASAPPEAEPLRAQDAAMPPVRPPADLLALQRLIARRASPRAERGPVAMDSAQVHEAAKRGTSGVSGPLPFLDTIQRSFGRHDVSGVAAHTDRGAASAARAVDATAFTTCDHVAFAEQPSLRTAAHEAAHVIQQRGGVQLEGGVGAAGDRYERHADAVADQIVQGNSAEALLDEHLSKNAGPSVQRETPTGTPKDPPPAPPQPAPARAAEDKAPAATPQKPAAPAPKTEDQPTNADNVPLQWTFKDVLAYPLLRDVFKDLLVSKEITPADRKLLALNGTEGAAFYAWTMAAGLAPSALGGGTRPKDFGDYAGAVYDYADALTGLTPANSAIFDPLSRLAGLRVDDYLGSGLFIARLKTHPLSIPTLLALVQGSWSLYYGLKSKNTDPTTLDSDPWAQQFGLAKKLVGGVFKEKMKAPTFFDMGPLKLATHPIFAYAPFAGGPAPSGPFFERKVDTQGTLREQQYGGTINLPKFVKPGGATPEDIGDPAKYRGWQGSAWFNYEAKNPLTVGPNSQPYSRFKGGTIFGGGGHLAELEAGAQYSGDDARALTSWFARVGYGYAADEKTAVPNKPNLDATTFLPDPKLHEMAIGLKKFGFTATFLDWKDTDVLAPRNAAGAPLAGWALRTTPFLGLSLKAGNKVTVDASAAVSFVTGQTGGQKLTAGVSDAAATLSVMYLGDSAPGKLPAFKVDLTGSVGRLDWWDENSPLLFGLQAKGNVGPWFAGAQVNTGAGSISAERKDAFDPKVKTMVPTAVLFTGGYSF